VNGGQKSTDQHHQQIDFHDFLRCAIAAHDGCDAKGVPFRLIDTCAMSVIG
jgi:hypothetical protein